MAAPPPVPKPGRALAGLLLGLIAAAAGIFLLGDTKPKLAIDLAGGASVTLQAKPAPGSNKGVTQEAMDEALSIIRQRVNGFGVSEAEVTKLGDKNIVVTIPEQGGQKVIDLVGQTALLRFRPVLLEADPAPVTQPLPDIPGLTPEVKKRFETLDCTQPENRQGGDTAQAGDIVVSCDREGVVKYILDKSAVEGTDVSDAQATLPQGALQWQVDLSFNGKGTREFASITRKVVNNQRPQNQVAIVLDGLVASAPTIQEAITGGRAQITGDFTQAEATDLANVLRYGALPLAFEKSEITTITPTLGSDQLTGGLLAGAIGLGLVVLYCLIYYRALGLVALASLVVASLITYVAVVLLGSWINYRLSLAGIAGLVVAIGITADSFVVFFERLRDEMREGRTVRAAVEHGWVRARRTVLVADTVSFLAAAVLYLLSVAAVKGFAFTLGLVTLIDVLVVFLFTKPLTTVVARWRFFGEGHRLSGVNPASLGVRAPLRAAPRRRAGVREAS